METKFNRQLRFLVYTALSIAIVTLLTLVIRIPSVKGGYINFGDIAIFIVSVLIGKESGALAGGIGSCLADIISGYAVYAPATFGIKGVEGFICGLISGRRRCGEKGIWRLVAAVTVSAVWMAAGYFLFEYKIGDLMFGNSDFGLTTAILNLPGNIAQGGVSALSAVAFILTLERTRMFDGRRL